MKFSEIHTFSFKKMHLKLSSGKWRPSCLGLNVLQSLRHTEAINHDGVIKWKHFPRYRPLYEGNPPVIGGFRSKKPVTRIFDAFLDLRLNKRFDKSLRSLWRHCNDCKLLYSAYLLNLRNQLVWCILKNVAWHIKFIWQSIWWCAFFVYWKWTM